MLRVSHESDPNDAALEGVDHFSDAGPAIVLEV